MTEHKKQLLFGYQVKAMDAYIKDLKEKYQKKDIELTTCRAAIDVLKEEVAIYKEKETQISQVLIDAKIEAKHILEKAEQQAETIKQATSNELTEKTLLSKENIRERFEQAAQEMHCLTVLKHEMLSQESALKEAFTDLLHQILNQICQLDLKSENDIVLNIEKYMDQFNEIIKRNQELLLGTQTNPHTLPVKDGTVPVSEQDEELPIFTFNT